MINKLLQIVAPHHCYGCAKVGSVLCEECKYDINDDAISGCVVCQAPSLSGICTVCHTSYQRAWCVGERSDTLRRLIDAYKFQCNKDVARALAHLLDTHLPQLPTDTVLIPVPTIRRHVRQRGYDHAYLICRELGRLRGIPVNQCVKRRGNHIQLGKTKRDRKRQASESFYVDSKLPTATYLIIDDVITTGATLTGVGETLRSAGASAVWAAVVARQPLQK